MSKVKTSKSRSPRAFILLVVVGLLAVMLGICISFISLTRTEVASVSHIRDKADLADLTVTAIDWTAANIQQALIDPATNLVKSNAVISSTHNTADPNYCWWYRTYDQGVSTWFPTCKANDEAQWVWMPQSHFPGGGVRGRFAVQVLDPNAFINVNDWLNDCNPTQCQMANMMMDALGGGFIEYQRANRDSLWTQAQQDNYWAWVKPPWRYNACWRVASRTVRYDGWSADPNQMSPHWITTNTTWMSLLGPEARSLRASANADRLSPWTFLGLPGMSVYAFTDPDTGRSPVNVNTCFNSGDSQLTNVWGGALTFTLNGVFNVESLRRIIKIGDFWNGTTYRNAQKDAATLTAAEKTQVERLRAKLAFQYQELLCRYFSATYGADYNYAAYPLRGYGPDTGAHENTFYNPIVQPFTVAKNYYNTYAGSIPAAEISKVKHAVQKSDNSATRFPCGPSTFRQWVKDDLRVIATNNKNSKYTGTNNDGKETVGVDKNGNFEIAPGKMDARTASAVFDNIVPGKAYLFSAAEEPNVEVRDPLSQLYAQRIGRDETQEPDPTMDVLGFVAADTRGGKDISGATVPYRQLVFGPDWFSTELTTASTTFYLVINTQLIDSSTAASANPTVLQQHQVVAVVEVAPGLEVTDVGEDGTAKGLHYYRDGKPNYFKTSPAGNIDSMDTGCNTLPPNDHTSIPSAWADYHGTVNPAAFYQPKSQNKARVTVRAFWDLNAMQ